MKFDLHTVESAPPAVKPELEAAQKAYGSVPNLYRAMATNPATLKVYLGFNQALQDHGCLSPIEQQVVYLTSSTENHCTYCVAAHSALAGMAEVPAQTITELREKAPLSDSKLNALRSFTLAVIEHRGWVSAEHLQQFASAGFEQCHVLEVLTILAQKTLSNYFNHIAETPLDSMFESQAWQPPASSAAR